MPTDAEDLNGWNEDVNVRRRLAKEEEERCLRSVLDRTSSEAAKGLEEIVALKGEIDKLACFILAEVPGEPSQNEGAVDTAIRIIRTLRGTLDDLAHFTLPNGDQIDLTDAQTVLGLLGELSKAREQRDALAVALQAIASEIEARMSSYYGGSRYADCAPNNDKGIACESLHHWLSRQINHQTVLAALKRQERINGGREALNFVIESACELEELPVVPIRELLRLWLDRWEPKE